jgi:hypothetical protein
MVICRHNNAAPIYSAPAKSFSLRVDMPLPIKEKGFYFNLSEGLYKIHGIHVGSVCPCAMPLGLSMRNGVCALCKISMPRHKTVEILVYIGCIECPALNPMCKEHKSK